MSVEPNKSSLLLHPFSSKPKVHFWKTTLWRKVKDIRHLFFSTQSFKDPIILKPKSKGRIRLRKRRKNMLQICALECVSPAILVIAPLALKEVMESAFQRTYFWRMGKDLKIQLLLIFLQSKRETYLALKFICQPLKKQPIHQKTKINNGKAVIWRFTEMGSL